MRYRIKFLSILTLICTVVLLPLFPTSVSATNLSELPWLLIEGSSSSIVNNPIPKQAESELSYAQKIITSTVSPNQTVRLSIDEKVIEDELRLDPADIEYEWKISDEEILQGNSVEITFPETGTHLFSLSILGKQLQQLIFTEDVMITIGTKEEAAAIVLNDSEVSPDDSIAIRTFRISRTKDMLFTVASPDESRYKYEWDLADGDYISASQASKVFGETKFPAYITLRTTNKDTGVFSDNYIILTSDDTPDYQVVRPVANEIPQAQTDSSLNGILALTVITLAVVLIVVVVLNRHRFAMMKDRVKRRS